MEFEPSAENPGWLALLLTAVAGFHLYLWISIVAALIFGGLFILTLGDLPVDHPALFSLAFMAAAAMLLAGLLFAYWRAIRLLKRFNAHLKRASVTAILAWAAFLAGLTFVVPSPYIYVFQ